MSLTPLKIPSDRSSDLYFDPNLQQVSFRNLSQGSKPSKGRPGVLRVVVEAFGSIVEDRFFSPKSRVTFGPKRQNVLAFPSLDLPKKHVLFKVDGTGKVTLRINTKFVGLIQKGSEPISELSSLQGSANKKGIFELDLSTDVKGCIDHGNLRIYFETIEDPEKVRPLSFRKSMTDPQFLRWLGISFGVHLLLVLLMLVLPKPKPKLKLEDLSKKTQRILVQTQEVKPYKPITPPKMRKKRKASGQGQEGEGARAGGQEGRRGKGIKGKATKNKAVKARDVQKTGVLDFFSKKKRSGALQDLIGGGSAVGDVDAKINRKGRYGLAGEKQVREGKGLKGSGTGGGNSTVGLGQGLGKKGQGGGAKGSGLADFGSGKSKTTVSASVDDEDVYVGGSIPRHIIAKIIQDHMGQIKYCYDRQLAITPDIGGKIVAQFIIGLQGRVTSANIIRSTLGSKPVEACITGVIRRMPFPKPGAGVVEVRYPFILRVAG